MAKGDRIPATHVVQLSPEQVECTKCDEWIEKGEPRLSEAIVGDDGSYARTLRYARNKKRQDEFDEDRGSSYDDSPRPDLAARYYHLECAAKHVPYRLSSALRSCTLPLDNRDQLLELMNREAEPEIAIDPAAANDATRGDYARFIDQLRDAPDDEGFVVFGDWLQTVGDPRGELVAVQLELETATGWARDRLLDTERKLFATHKQLQPDDRADAFTWRRGFVYRVNLAGISDQLSHPSLQVVRELAFSTLPSSLPATLRTIEIECYGKLPAVDVAKLPALRRLVLRATRDFGTLIEALIATKLFAKIHELALHGPLSLDDLEPLRAVKKNPRLALLDLRGTTLPHDAKVGKLATTVELPAAPAPAAKVVKGPWLVRHPKRPEWGIGRVLDETEQGLQVEFETAGTKLIRDADLLEDVS